MQLRQQYRSSHLLELAEIKRSEEKNVCSVLYKLQLLIEYPFKCLEEEIKDKINAGRREPFLEAELWSVLYSCCVGLELLYRKKMPHESLTAS
jgi:hypothetical protein